MPENDADTSDVFFFQSIDRTESIAKKKIVEHLPALVLPSFIAFHRTPGPSPHRMKFKFFFGNVDRCNGRAMCRVEDKKRTQEKKNAASTDQKNEEERARETKQNQQKGKKKVNIETTLPAQTKPVRRQQTKHTHTHTFKKKIAMTFLYIMDSLEKVVIIIYAASSLSTLVASFLLLFCSTTGNHGNRTGEQVSLAGSSSSSSSSSLSSLLRRFFCALSNPHSSTNATVLSRVAPTRRFSHWASLLLHRRLEEREEFRAERLIEQQANKETK